MLRRFFAGLWDLITSVKNALGNLIFLLIIGVIVLSIFQSESVSVPESSALIINPTGVIVEQKQAVDPIAEFLSDYENEESETLLKDILIAIKSAETDDRIKLLVLDLHRFQGAAFSKLEEVGDALESFKSTGKPIYAFGKSFSQSQYYLASHANQIFLDENSHQALGGVFLTGLSVYPMYYKTALDKFKINFHIYKAGLYKSAVEPMTRDDMSPEAKLANSVWLGQLWSEYADTVTKERGISPENFAAYSDEYDVLLATANSDPNLLAVQQNLVDDLITKQEWIDQLQDIVGGTGTSFNHISLYNYLAATQSPLDTMKPGSQKIAVITASGVILDGERPAGEIGGKSLSRLIRQAREDNSVKAVVLRIDSPGGSPSASEDIRGELLRTKEAGKPVVVSMSSYAASGGYWISANANKIFALSTTITGSIGVFSTFPTFEKIANEYGIYTDGVGTTKLSGSLSALQDVNPILDSALNQSVKHTYSKFVSIVAKGRGKTFHEIDEIAQGRVWTAKDALNNGLIDAIGNLDDAINSAAMLADISDYEVLNLEKQRSNKEALIHELLNSSLKTVYEVRGKQSIQQTGIRNSSLLNTLSKQVKELMAMSQNAGLYTHCLECNISL
ncbi:MAG: protease-4 [Candidatus Azotimanducaceae bacterium]|jgi:protease-4